MKTLDSKRLDSSDLAQYNPDDANVGGKDLNGPGLSIQEVADYLKVSRGTIYNECNAGRLKTYTIGKRRFVLRSSLITYENQLVKGAMYG